MPATFKKIRAQLGGNQPAHDAISGFRAEQRGHQAGLSLRRSGLVRHTGVLPRLGYPRLPALQAHEQHQGGPNIGGRSLTTDTGDEDLIDGIPGQELCRGRRHPSCS